MECAAIETGHSFFCFFFFFCYLLRSHKIEQIVSSSPPDALQLFLENDTEENRTRIQMEDGYPLKAFKQLFDARHMEKGGELVAKCRLRLIRSRANKEPIRLRADNWPNGLVPFKIRVRNPELRKLVLDAMRHVNIHVPGVLLFELDSDSTRILSSRAVKGAEASSPLVIRDDDNKTMVTSTIGHHRLESGGVLTCGGGSGSGGGHDMSLPLLIHHLCHILGYDHEEMAQCSYSLPTFSDGDDGAKYITEGKDVLRDISSSLNVAMDTLNKMYPIRFLSDCTYLTHGMGKVKQPWYDAWH